MKTYPNRLIPILALCALRLSLEAQSPQPAATLVPANVLTCKASELPQHPLHFGGLDLTITRFVGEATFRFRTVNSQISNPTTEFLTFQPSELTVVGAGNEQTMLIGWREGINYQADLHIIPASIRIAPGATLAMSYLLEKSVKAPLRLYLGDNLVAKITD